MAGEDEDNSFPGGVVFFQTLAAGTWAKLVGPGASSGEGTQWF